MGEVTAVAWPGQVDRAVGLADVAGRMAEWPGLGRRGVPALRLVVVDSARFARFAAGRVPAWGAGLALPGSRTIVLRADAGDLARVLRHELAHLVLHDAIRSRVPLWFDEGYATWAAGGTDGFDLLELNLAVVRGDVRDLEQLDGGLRGSAMAASAAYPLAASAVLELARRNPTGSLAPLLARLGAGEDFDAAVRATTGLTTGQFEREWRQSIRRRFGFLAWSLAGGLWAGLAVTVLALGWVRRRADRGRRAALDIGWELPAEAAEDEAAQGAIEEGPEPPELDRTAGTM